MTPLARASSRCLCLCEHSSVTCEPCCLTVVAKYFFICLPRVVGHVVAPKPSCAGGRGLELRDAWSPRSPPEQGDEVHSHGTHGGSRALSSREAGSGATGCIAALPCREAWSSAVGHAAVHCCTTCFMP
jgi:hypothetical protein